jgi:acetylglutamate kinase
VKLGSSVLDEACLQRKLLTDIAFVATVGIQPIIFFGRGKTIAKAVGLRKYC